MSSRAFFQARRCSLYRRHSAELVAVFTGRTGREGDVLSDIFETQKRTFIQFIRAKIYLSFYWSPFIIQSDLSPVRCRLSPLYSDLHQTNYNNCSLFLLYENVRI